MAGEKKKKALTQNWDSFVAVTGLASFFGYDEAIRKALPKERFPGQWAAIGDEQFRLITSSVLIAVYDSKADDVHPDDKVCFVKSKFVQIMCIYVY